MTLILSHLSRAFVLQSSDRLVTRLHTGADPTPFDSVANKTIVYLGRVAHFSLESIALETSNPIFLLGAPCLPGFGKRGIRPEGTDHRVAALKLRPFDFAQGGLFSAAIQAPTLTGFSR
jgi:hypothetical protein